MPLHIFPQPEEWWNEDKELLWNLDNPEYTPTIAELEQYREVVESSDYNLTRRPRSLR